MARPPSRSSAEETAYIVFDTESVPDGALLSRVLYPGDNLSPEAAIARFEEEEREKAGGKPKAISRAKATTDANATTDARATPDAKTTPDAKANDGDPASRPGDRPFVPVTFQVPVAVGVARIGPDYRLLDLSSLDAPRYDPQELVRLFWRGIQYYASAVPVTFNGRGFDFPLLTLAALRFGVSCPRYFDETDRFGMRYRYTQRNIDLLDWLTEYGAFRLKGGLDLCAKLLGKPGKMDTKGDQVHEMYRAGRLQEINDYCLHDVLDTYFVFLRTRVLTGQLSLDEEQARVQEAKEWIEARAAEQPALARYIESFGAWSPEPFR